MEQNEEHKEPAKTAAARRTKNNTVLVSALVALVFGMVGMSYAAVPLYQMFCQVTGYGGTTQRAEAAPDKILEKSIEVRLDANTAKGINWKFRSQVKTINLKIGDTALVHYEAKNMSDKGITGTATFNVTPDAAGVYFNKIECFCFTEQYLAPGESVDMPVTFFIDPKFATNPDTKNIKEISLSYTFFPHKGDGKESVAAPIVSGDGKSGS